jgi:LPXTG-site transpeptidase (sortase) family protein
MNATRVVRLQFWIAGTLIAGGTIVLAWVGVDAARVAAIQRAYQRTLHNPATDGATSAASRTPGPAIGDPIGWLEIPRLGVSAAVVHGDTDALLKTAIGHLPDTPLPWSGGNSALAGHRDTFFSRLRHVRPNDRVRLRTPQGQFEYSVRGTFVVEPEELWVLDPTPTTTLTLITCYPFNFVGNAPRRFIVRAERIDAPQTSAAAGTNDDGSRLTATK